MKRNCLPSYQCASISISRINKAAKIKSKDSSSFTMNRKIGTASKWRFNNRIAKRVKLAKRNKLLHHLFHKTNLQEVSQLRVPLIKHWGGKEWAMSPMSKRQGKNKNWRTIIVLFSRNWGHFIISWICLSQKNKILSFPPFIMMCMETLSFGYWNLRILIEAEGSIFLEPLNSWETCWRTS